jgi:dTDP-4-amino-4,6-dideoxygalactose transaminase
MSISHKLAILGGEPIRKNILTLSKINFDIKDIIDKFNYDEAITKFSQDIKKFIGCKYVLPLSSDSATLHTVLSVIDIQYDDEIIISPMSPVSIINAIICVGAVPIFCDIDESTLNMDVNLIEKLITKRTKAILTIDYGGQTCNYDILIDIKNKFNILLIQDASYSIGGYYNLKKNGLYSDITIFSFYDIKHIMNGGVIMTNDLQIYNQCKIFSNYGIDNDKLVDIGQNYNITPIQCLFGLHKLSVLTNDIISRKKIYSIIDTELYKISDLAEPVYIENGSTHCYYIIKLVLDCLITNRNNIIDALIAEGIDIFDKVSLTPPFMNKIYTHAFKNEYSKFSQINNCPIAQEIYDRIIIIPIYTTMSLIDINDIIKSLRKVLNYYKK